MAIRDRGKLKWQPASFMPVAFEMQREMFKDQERMSKLILDECEKEEFDQNLAYAMECDLAVKLTVWSDGFTKEMTGHIHNINPITHLLQVEVKPGEFEPVAFEYVVGVTVLD
ncbi:YolD-like family protein [Bacillus sp. ISL-75]|uniref:YolD-like family protein n=1 Tax=Bacillus sp. ISL-75 TaxID=2819137 RepID=UPI001BE66CA2|nr:YolD-like family protein [Bacillus sp. ISL-75]MBT2730551.1 YolD-like family protein [Bacillus sp. ISL-75]